MPKKNRLHFKHFKLLKLISSIFSVLTLTWKHICHMQIVLFMQLNILKPTGTTSFCFKCIVQDLRFIFLIPLGILTIHAIFIIFVTIIYEFQFTIINYNILFECVLLLQIKPVNSSGKIFPDSLIFCAKTQYIISEIQF